MGSSLDDEKRKEETNPCDHSQDGKFIGHCVLHPVNRQRALADRPTDSIPRPCSTTPVDHAKRVFSRALRKARYFARPKRDSASHCSRAYIPDGRPFLSFVTVAQGGIRKHRKIWPAPVMEPSSEPPAFQVAWPVGRLVRDTSASGVTPVKAPGWSARS
jgi:hypothetical protein